jgi:prepilin-type processing-associated H-X9-DG protein
MSKEVETSETSQQTAEGCANSALRMLFLLFVGGIVGYLLLPQCITYRSTVNATVCRNNLKHIMIALHNYHDTYKCFPPAYVPDEDGRPMHSWRALILPFLEQADLYERYRFDEPWNGPNNSQLAAQIPTALRCPSEPNDYTNYLLISGHGTAWGDGQVPTFADFKDGTSNTIVLVEVADSRIQWMEPRDLALEQATRGINSGLGMCISSPHPIAGGKTEKPESANVAFADGSVTILKNDFPLDELKKLLTHQGEERAVPPK